ncbi:MAG TPA: M15 family metallopeptidase [Candidatus Saccharimonadales bacterium]|nr:M15 family metallopeptidase [Candidatus Saccharimonadales bacterium]
MISPEPLLYPPIPLNAGQIKGWREIPIRESERSDPLVPLGPLSPEANALMASSVYFGEHNNSPYASENNKLEGSLLTLFACQSTAQRLLAAEQLLPDNHHLLILDAYRPYDVQHSLYDFYKQKLQEKHPNIDNGALEAETQKYVSLPSTDPRWPSPHSTGGVVDAVIVKLDKVHEEELLYIRSRLANNTLDFTARVGLEIRLSALMRHTKMLDFGTAFDHGGEKSALTYYESKLAAGNTLTEADKRACDNRRLLFMIMTRAGFQAYSPEWWHFDAPESQWGAATAGLSYASLDAAKLNKNNRAHENKRLKIYQEILKLQRKGDRAIAHTSLQAEILAAIRETGDLNTAGDWLAEIIAPPET